MASSSSSSKLACAVTTSHPSKLGNHHFTLKICFRKRHVEDNNQQRDSRKRVKVTRMDKEKGLENKHEALVVVVNNESVSNLDMDPDL